MVELGLLPFVNDSRRLSLRSCVTAETHEEGITITSKVNRLLHSWHELQAAVLLPEQDEDSMVELMGSICSVTVFARQVGKLGKLLFRLVDDFTQRKDSLEREWNCSTAFNAMAGALSARWAACRALASSTE